MPSCRTARSAAELQDCARTINEWLAKGKLLARIDRVMPLAEAAQAHQLMEDSQGGRVKLHGKIVLAV